MLDVTRYWYRPSLNFITFLLLPFSIIFSFCAAIRRWLYRVGALKTHHFTVPVIVVGNIAIGGTGKTPFVIWLVEFLISQGYRPGIVSRGVGGKQTTKPHWVKIDDFANEVGDEAILLAERAHCPVVISPDRVAAVEDLLQNSDCNIVISDDGLQHYRLGRDIEIAIVDGMRRFGNTHLLPAGPLREPIERLKKVDFVIVNGGNDKDTFVMTLEPQGLVSLQHPETIMNLIEFPDKKVHAVAGIGHPERFFLLLKNAGFDVIAHPFGDHYPYQSYDFDFTDSLPILMTEKDAVKCKKFATEHYWYVKVAAKLNNRLEQKLLEKIKTIR